MIVNLSDEEFISRVGLYGGQGDPNLEFHVSVRVGSEWVLCDQGPPAIFETDNNEQHLRYCNLLGNKVKVSSSTNTLELKKVGIFRGHADIALSPGLNSWITDGHDSTPPSDPENPRQINYQVSESPLDLELLVGRLDCDDETSDWELIDVSTGSLL